MRFALDASQLDFASSLDSMLGAADVPSVSRALASGDVLPCRTLWTALGELGVTGLTIDPEFDGLGADPVDMVVALERMGKWAVPGPVVESIVAVPALLGALPSEQQREWLPGLASGQLIATVAMEPNVPYAVDPAMADVVLLARTTSGSTASGSTASGSTASVSTATVVAVHESIDPSRRLGEVVAGGTQIAGGDSPEAIDRADVLATLACAAQLLGAGQAMLDATVEYAKSRQQFGRPIGSFQAIKHALADVFIGLELARPVLFNAALSVGANSRHARRDVAAAKIVCGTAANTSSRTALQVHGAIGYTMEYDLSLWTTKVRALQSSWGTGAVHRRRVLESL